MLGGQGQGKFLRSLFVSSLYLKNYLKPINQRLCSFSCMFLISGVCVMNKLGLPCTLFKDIFLIFPLFKLCCLLSDINMRFFWLVFGLFSMLSEIFVTMSY